MTYNFNIQDNKFRIVSNDNNYERFFSENPYCATADAGILCLIKNPTLSAPLTYVNNGVVQDGTANAGQTITANTGQIICAIPVGASGGTDVMKENFLSFLSQSITNTMDEYVLAYIPTTNNQLVNGVINIKSY